MGRMMVFTYSSGCISSFKELVQEIFDIFSYPCTTDDAFYYGVFCVNTTYAFFEWDKFNTGTLEIPMILSADTSYLSEKINYVNNIIEQVLIGNIEKPEWMIYVEQEFSCYDCNSPSTFLYVKEKDEKYKKLGDLLIKFLYSPSHGAVKII